MKKIDKIINVIGLIILITIILVFNFIIGANEKGLRILPIGILMSFATIYLVVLKIKNKKDSIFFKSKIDYLVLLFMICTTLPLIFKTYASYSDTVEFIMKYFFIYSVYILARNVIKDKKCIELIISIALVCSLIPLILGFDYNNAQMLKGFMNWLNVTYNQHQGFDSVFGYANAQAVYVAVFILLAMHKFKMHKNKVLKILDIIYILLATYVIFITESRAVIILLGITLLGLFVAKFRKPIVKHRKKIIVGIGIIAFILGTCLIILLNISKPVESTEDVDEKIRYNFKKNQMYTLGLNMTTGNIDETMNNRK